MSKVNIIIAVILLVATTSCISSTANRERKNKAFTRQVQRANVQKL